MIQSQIWEQKAEKTLGKLFRASFRINKEKVLEFNVS